jgi:YegS/Rv2252/BmrU family lipid kinase
VEEVLIFANPIAGRGRGKSIARRLEARLRADGFAVRLLLKKPDLLEREDLGDSPNSPTGPKAAIVIGGDGTLRAVAQRLYGVTPPLLVVPLGTANLMGRHLGIKWNDQTLEGQVSRAIRRGRVVALDAGRANGKIFLLMVGVGYDAAVVHELARVRKGPIGYANYVLPAALALRDYEYPSLEVTVDQKQVFASAPAIAFVGNVAEYGTGFPLLPKARPDDGLLDICVIPCSSPLEMVHYFLRAAAGEHLQEEKVVYLRGKHVRIHSKRQVPVQIDGDAAGHTPVNIDLLPIRLPFIVPE